MYKFINPNTLIVTQELIRNLDSIFHWIDCIKNGEKLPKVKLTKFNDSPGLYIHDGHTRLIAASISGLTLEEDEFDISVFNLADYTSVNLNKDYVTPFNPVTHVRYSDFFHVKQFILKELKYGGLSAIDIPKLSGLYSRPRRIMFLYDLAAKYKPLIESIQCLKKE